MNKTPAYKIVFWVCLVTALAMMVTGFFMPPQGVIDKSVLYGAGICLAFAALAQLPVLMTGHDLRVNYGKTSVEIHDNDNEDGA